MSRPSDRVITGITIALLTAVTTVLGQANPEHNSASRPKVVIVELFTSEGCSSCPPADDLLRKINGKQTSAGQLIVGISEHVTYWNSEGWSDPFSSPIYTNHQNAYGANFGVDSVYTPQMVVNGKQQFVGSDVSSLAKALREEQDQASALDMRILSVSVTGDLLTVNFSATDEISYGSVDVVAVLTDDADQSRVLSGENSGRTLSHVAVARALVQVAKLQAAAQQTVQIALPSSIRTAKAHHLILLAQTSGSGRILGADSEPLQTIANDPMIDRPQPAMQPLQH